MKTKTYTWDCLERAAQSILVQLYNDNWKPDYVVGITRGGLPLATLLSHLTKATMHTLDVRLRDPAIGMGPESNLWLAEDAFGYVPFEEQETYKCRWDINRRKKILIVDDINDTGATFNWIKEDWQGGCLPGEDNAWNSVWENSVRFAVMTENLSSDFHNVKYYYDTVNKAEEDVWLIYPWEYATKRT